MRKYYHSLVLADGQDGASHVELKREISWGQSPQLANWEAPTDRGQEEWYGWLEVGDRLRFLMGGFRTPVIRHPVRVEVATHERAARGPLTEPRVDSLAGRA